MTDHQHAADAGRDTGGASGPPPAGPGAEASADPRTHAHAGAHGRAGARTKGTGPVGAGPTGAGATAASAGRSTDTDPPGSPGAPGVPGAAGAAGAADGGSVPEPRFRRERHHKVLAGVCSGLGRRCDMDPVIFRITLAVLSATGGIGLIFYGFAWLLVPYDDEEGNEVRKLLTGRVDGQALTAVLFALVGCGVFLTMVNNGDVLSFAVVLSLLLAGAGYWSQRRGAPDPDPLAAQAVADAPPEAKAPPVPATYPSWWRDPIVKDGKHVGGTGYLWGPSDSRDRDIAAAVTIGRTTHEQGARTPRPPAPAQPKPRAPRWIGGWVCLLALLGGALTTRLTWEDHPLGTSVQAGLACMLIVLGLGIAVSAFVGRTGAGSVLLAVVAAGLLAVAAALPKDIGTHWTRTTWRPAAVSEVRPQYELGIGVGTLDLSRLDLGEVRRLGTSVEVGVGRVVVVVPPDMTVKANIDVGVGDIQLPGEDRQDVDVAAGRAQEATLPPAGGTGSEGTIELDLRVAVGQVEVSRAAS